MPDHATSTSPDVQHQLDRLMALGPGADILGLDRITRLLDRLGNPERALPPLFHVAGTNGKGSTCAFLRAALEADGKRVHVYSSPHLVRFNERIRVVGRLIDDAALARLLEEVLDRGGDIGASFFEVTTAAAFLHFARIPADACVIEVGLGGRLDATNVIAAPAVCGIAQLGLDHEAFLGRSLTGIAREKAGIAKAGRPIVASAYPVEIAEAVAQVAAAHGATLLAAPDAWHYAATGEAMLYRDRMGTLTLPLPALPGPHQQANLALATAMLRHQNAVPVSAAAMERAAGAVRWPARMQALRPGPLLDLLPAGSGLWLDGGHNPAAGEAVARALAGVREAFGPARVHLVIGMLANKDPHGLLAPILPLVNAVSAVPVPGHAHHMPELLCEVAAAHGVMDVRTADDVPGALTVIGQGADGPVLTLVLGSLYLAGTVLAANDEAPD